MQRCPLLYHLLYSQHCAGRWTLVLSQPLDLDHWIFPGFHRIEGSSIRLLGRKSKALAKSMNKMYTPAFHSRVCSIIFLSRAIWSVQDHSFQNTACSPQSLASKAPLILSRMIFARILLTMVSNVIPLQFPHWPRSPFFGSFAIIPFFQSVCISSSFQICFNSFKRASADTLSPALNASGGMLSTPPAFFRFSGSW